MIGSFRDSIKNGRLLSISSFHLHMEALKQTIFKAALNAANNENIKTRRGLNEGNIKTSQ